MKAEYMTAALCGYFRGSPSGYFSPARVREEMDITNGEWRRYALNHLYPEDSIARKRLAEIGVTITTEDQPRQKEYGLLKITNFYKEPRRSCLATKGRTYGSAQR